MRLEYISEQKRDTKLKKMDKRMERVLADFKRNHLVMKKAKNSLAKMKSAGRYIAALPAEPWISAFCYFVINALPSGGAGKMKKTLMKLIKEHYSLSEWSDVEPLYESLIDNSESQRLMEDFEPLMDMEELELLWEVLVMEVELLEDEFESSGPLTVSKLNEEISRIVKPKKLSVKEQKRLRFYQFLKSFEEKLLTLGISGDENLANFIEKLIRVIPRVSIGKGKEVRKVVPSKSVVGG